MFLAEGNNTFRSVERQGRLDLDRNRSQLIQKLVDLFGFDSISARSDEQSIGTRSTPKRGNHNPVFGPEAVEDPVGPIIFFVGKQPGEKYRRVKDERGH